MTHRITRIIQSKWFKPALVGLVFAGAVVFATSAGENGGMLSRSGGGGSAAPSDNPLDGIRFYVDPESRAARQAADWQSSRPADAALMAKLAELPTARWLTDDASLDNGLATYLDHALSDKSVPVLVVYNIPNRDCGLYSAGGSKSPEAYRVFIDKLAQIAGDQRAVFIIEPDALASMDTQKADGNPCLDGKQLGERYEALNYATETLSSLKQATVYIDAGNSAWGNDLDKVAMRLEKAGIEKADGFSLNVSNFQTLEDTNKYGAELSDRLQGAHYVVDTSRNGVGPYRNTKNPAYNWCNPPERALGHYPTTQTGNWLADAYLYIKTPGESDGQDTDPAKCHGGPRAGEWWPDYALGLIKRWPAEFQPPATR